MKNLSYALTMLLLVISIFSCDKREDVFEVNNEAPKMEINAVNTPSSSIKDYTSEVLVIDSFNFNLQNYFINFRIEDESKNMEFEYLVDNNATIELVEITEKEENNKAYTEGIVKVVPTNIGLHKIDLIATDPYDLAKRISIDLNVYLSNISPALSISTVGNVGSNNATLVNVDITDTFSLSQGDILIDYLIIDDNLNYNFNFSTTNGGSIVEDLNQKNIINQTYSVAVSGQLKLTPATLGLHDVTITVTDDIAQVTTLHAYIYITDIPAVITVNPGINAFSSFNSYVSNFQNEVYLNQLGSYKVKYRIVDDSPTPSFTYSVTNSGTITENLGLRTVTTNGGISTINGQLEITANVPGIHTIDLMVTEPAGVITSSNKADLQDNANPNANISLWLPFTNDLRITYSATDANSSTFNDVITNYDFELYKNSSLVYSNSTSTSVSGMQFNLSVYGSGTYYGRVRATDSYGGVSNWKVSNTISN